MDITNVVIYAIVFIFAVLSGVVMPNIIQKYGKDNISKAMSIIGILVKAAEQIYKEAGLGKTKLNWVEKQFEKQGLKIDTNLVRAMIESEVYKLKKGA